VLAQDNRRTRRAVAFGLILFGATVGLLVVLPYYLSYQQESQRQQEELLLQEKASPALIQKCQALGADELSQCEIWQTFVEQHLAAQKAAQTEWVAAISANMLLIVFFSLPFVSTATIVLSAYTIIKYWNKMKRNVYGILSVAAIIAAVAVAIYAALFFYLMITIDD
jgi:hypothetical protein